MRAGHARVGDAHDRRGRRVCVEPERIADMREDRAPCAASTSSLASLPPIGRSALMRPSTTWASVSVGRVAARAVADRSRHRAGAFGPDLQQSAAIDGGDRAAAGADGRDLDHRRADDEPEIDRRLRRERGLAPAISETSNDVPPRSAVITLSKPAALAIADAGDHAGGRAGERGAHRELARAVASTSRRRSTARCGSRRRSPAAPSAPCRRLPDSCRRPAADRR